MNESTNKSKIITMLINYRSKWLLFTFITMTCIVMTACQAGDDTAENGTQEPAMPQAPIEVAFSTDPESGITVGEPVTLIATVTQEGKFVNDADLVRFEIWEEDEEGGKHHNDQHKEGEEGDENHDHNHDAMEGHETDHEMIEAEFRGDGEYVIVYTFEKTGIYNVMYHVDARTFHAMSAHQVIVEDEK